jgi:hypothetical protein
MVYARKTTTAVYKLTHKRFLFSKVEEKVIMSVKSRKIGIYETSLFLTQNPLNNKGYILKNKKADNGLLVLMNLNSRVIKNCFVSPLK